MATRVPRFVSRVPRVRPRGRSHRTPVDRDASCIRRIPRRRVRVLRVPGPANVSDPLRLSLHVCGEAGVSIAMTPNAAPAHFSPRRITHLGDDRDSERH